MAQDANTAKRVRGRGALLSRLLGRTVRDGRTHAAERRLILFTRYPEPGRTKTRLIPALGARGAADLQRRMTERAVEMAQRLSRCMPVSLEVRFSGSGPHRMQQWLGRDLPCLPQQGDDLGQRMAGALGDALADGARRAVLIGTDVPGLDAALLASAFERLADYDVVLGPARDGGYYLVGLRRPAPGLFQGIPWGTGRVLQHTLHAARTLGLSHTLLDELQDVDTPEDLESSDGRAWGAVLTPDVPAISVIVPTLNEAEHLEAALASIRPGRNVEAIVVDGGSRDGTPGVARRAGAKLLRGPRHRARQCNLGAEAARGALLVFLHADTLLPPGYDEHVRRVLGREGTALGAFELAIAGEDPWLRVVERGVRWRSRRWRTPYGDQALFVRAEVFRALGGFPELPLMDDYELVRRARRTGRVVTAPARVLTSGRRWKRLGVPRATLINYGIVLAHHLGVPAERLARWYRSAGKAVAP